jgi:hypothetical protein
MAIKYLPNQVLGKIAPERKIDKLMTSRLTLKRAALSFLSDASFLSKDTIERTALNVINSYQDKYDELKNDGAPAEEAKLEAVNDKKLLVNRVQNEVIVQVASEIKDQYLGEFYKWLPSTATTPDPIHQLNYGKKFQIGKGEMPGDRYGCRCGMYILVKENKLDL